MTKPRIDERCIRQTEAELVRLHEALHEAFARRKASASRLTAWKSAAERFRLYDSQVFELWSDEAREGILRGENGWRESALLYLDRSPRFFRSGYLRDRLCYLLKQCELSEAERDDVRRILLESLERRPSVGRFGYDCRRAARWADKFFVARLEALAERKDGWTRGRARLMLGAIEYRKHLEGSGS